MIKRYKNYADPILYVIEKYMQNRDFKTVNKPSEDGGGGTAGPSNEGYSFESGSVSEDLYDYPLPIFFERNNGKITDILYGEQNEKDGETTECSYINTNETIIRDARTGLVTGIKTLYTDGTESLMLIERDSSNKIVSIRQGS